MGFPIVLIVSILVFPATLGSAVSGQVQGDYIVQAVFPQLTFNQPVGILSAEDASGRLFVIEQPGTIRVFQNSANSPSSTVFLNISDRVLFSGEQGLLGLAFNPDYAQNGFFYVDYVAANPTRTIIARYSVSSGTPNQADKTSEFILLEIPQPFANHKGGQLAFGPDGYLYIGMGDGGSAGDPLGNGQNRSTLLGKILRIDINAASAGLNYSIPSDNPFAGNVAGYRQEIYTYGFRNPWRFSFDSTKGQLWVGDVGQDRLEEIDVAQKGLNYGWNIMEGTLPYAGGNEVGLQLPVYEYNHTMGIAIIGGYVYRGASNPELDGAYIYGDYGSGKIWALALNSSGAVSNTQLTASGLTISSFGVDQAGELYICAFDGKIYQLAASTIPELLPSITIAGFVAATLFSAVAVRKRRLVSSLPEQGNL